WSAVDELLRWAWFFCEPEPAVLAAASVEEMLSVQVIRDACWRAGHGLGLMLMRRGDRVYAGHGGAMPGYLTGLMFSPAERIAAAVLTSASALAQPDGLAG